MKKYIDVFDFAGHICKAMRKGVLLTTASGNKVNTMTIGWGKIGIEWNRPIFIAYVRESRYTRQLLDEKPEFTVNIPYGEFESRILSFCGTKSGRDTDKLRALRLTAEPSESISVPGICQLPLTLECKVIYRQKQDLGAIDPEHIARFYPVASESCTPDPHIAYYGEIVNAYIITD